MANAGGGGSSSFSLLGPVKQKKGYTLKRELRLSTFLVPPDNSLLTKELALSLFEGGFRDV